MFTRTQEYRKIKAELISAKAISKTAKFHNFADSIFTFILEHDECTHIFEVSCDDMIHARMKVSELLNLEKITYFSHQFFFGRYRESGEEVGSVLWSVYQDSGLN